MNYELAKQLKDAEFSQEVNRFGSVYLLERDDHAKEKEYFAYQIFKPISIENSESPFDNENHNYYKIPTLSELIETVLEEKAGFKISYKPEFSNWKAVLYHQGKADDGNGSTPEEAVAKLWLAINKGV